MWGYLIRRLTYAACLVLSAAAVVFVLVNVAPGDPVVAIAGEDGDAGYYAMMREKFGLDRPLGERLLIFIGNLLRGEFGFSWRYGRPALDVVLDHLPATLLLVVPALALAITIGVGLGLLAASRLNGGRDVAVSVLVLFGGAVPGFWLAQIAVLVFAFQLGLFPIQGMVDVRARHTGFALTLDMLHHMALPVLLLALGYLAPIARITRAGLLESFGAPFVRTARAKGAPSPLVLRRHALGNARLPVVTLIGEQIGFMLAGAVLIETVFAWPGLGRLLLSAMLNRDFALITAMFMVIAVSVVIANLVTDLLYGYLDPRARLA